MKRKPFSWFDLSRLMHDPGYLDQLASELRYPYPQKLGEVLKDCVDVLVAIRPGVKDYKNTRKLRIDNAVLSDLPKYASKIKKLCQSDQIKTWASHPAYVYNFVEFYFDIDQLDLLALLTINSIDDAIAQAHMSQAMEYWDMLQVSKVDRIKGANTGEILLKHYRDAARYRQRVAGIKSAAGNKWKSVCDDLTIAVVILALFLDDRFKSKIWHSLNELVEDTLSEVNIGLRNVPLSANQSEMGNVSEHRLKAVLKEINHLNKDLVNSYVKTPIPDIKDEDSRWHKFNIVMKHDPELNFTYPMPKIKQSL